MNQFKISQSSNLSLYCRIFFLMEEVSTQPTWSQSCRVTRKAGSVTISAPILTWPCSMKVMASFMVYENFKEQSSTANLLLQNAETEIFSATSILSFELRIPILYSFSNNCSVALILNASSNGNCLILQMRPVMSPHILLQCVQSSRFCRWQRCITLDSRLSASTFQSQKLVFFSNFCQWNFSLRIVDYWQLQQYFQYHMNQGWIHEFFTFRSTKEPLAGTFKPYTQPFNNSPICQGLDHFEKSEVGMASLLVCVSIVSGRMVMTLASRYDLFSAFSAKLVARQCTPALASAQAIISACGSLQAAAAPVKTMIPLGSRNLVARWAARRLGQRLTSFMSLTFSMQSASLILPPVHPPAVTRIALYLIPIPRILSITDRLFSSTFLSFSMIIFFLACS